MKYLGIIAAIFLIGCESTPNYCDKNPTSKMCDVNSYSLATYEALIEFEQLKGKKAFALVQAPNGGEAFGYAYRAQSHKKAQQQALVACQRRARMFKVNAMCEIIR